MVLKLGFPDRESRYEPAALRQWNGDGAIRLLEHDTDRHAMLLERCLPGTPLSDLDLDAAIDVMIDLLPRLWTPAAEPFVSLVDEAAHRAGYLEKEWETGGRPYPRLLTCAWSSAQTVAWCFDDEGSQHFEVAQWLHDAA